MYQQLRFLDKNIKAAQSGKFAVFDLGSNSLRLMIFNDIEKYPHQYVSERFRAKLAEGKSCDNFYLSGEKIENTIKAMRWFDWICKEQNVQTAVVVATSAIRDAENSDHLVKLAKKELNIPINIINGETEARLSALGALNSVRNANGLVLDLGGGSLEIYCTQTRQQLSLPLGVLPLRELSEDNVEKAVEILKQELLKHDWLVNSKGTDIVVVGGGMRSIAFLNMEKTGYPIKISQGYKIDKADLFELLPSLLDLKSSKIEFKGYDEKFKRAIPFRAALLKALFEINQNFKDVKFSSFGLREGVLFSQIDKQDYNLAERYAKDMATEKGFGLEYSLSSYSFISDVMQNVDHDLLYLTALLKDIAWKTHKQYRADILFDEILHLDFVGVDHNLRLQIALACYFSQENEYSLRLQAIIRNLLTSREILLCKLVGQMYKLTELINPGRNGNFSGYEIKLNKQNEIELAVNNKTEEIIYLGLNKRLGRINKLLQNLNQIKEK